MTPELQGAVADIQRWRDTGRIPLNASIEALLASHATLKSENEQLRQLQVRVFNIVDDERKAAVSRAEAAEAQLATAQREAWEEGREAGAKIATVAYTDYERGAADWDIGARYVAEWVHDELRKLPNPYEKEPGT
jgi:hypothetical protein